MSRMKYVSVLAAALATSCASYSSDFSIKQEATQPIVLENVEQVVLTCYCYKSITVTKSKELPPQIRFAGVLDSVGYHGDGENPERIPEDLMRFEEKRSGKMLFLESKEWSFMHHAFMVSDVEIIVPQGIEVRTVTIPFAELEGRAQRE